MTRKIALCAALLLLASQAAPARADDEGEREARALFREGNRLVKEGDYTGALQMFQSAYARLPSPKILLNIGTTFQLLGRHPEAGDTYERYLADPDADPKRRAEVEAALRKIDAGIGKLRITVDEPGARVVVDGGAVGESPQAILLRVKVGTHTVVAEKQGVAPAVATIQVSAGEERIVDLRLVTRSVDTETVTGEPVPAPDEPSPGGTVLDPRRVVRPVDEAPFLPRRDEKPGAAGPPAWAPWAALGVSVLAAGAGAYFGTKALDASASIADQRSAATGANISFAVAGVAAVSAGGLWYWRYRARP